VTAHGAPRKVKTDPLRRQADFERIYRHGRRARGKWLTVVMLPRDDEPICRAAFVVSRKVARQAVRRNRLRRRLREALRVLRKQQELSTPADLIVIPAPQAVEAAYADLREELQLLLTRLKLWRPDLPPVAAAQGVTGEAGPEHGAQSC
jgi:ribonuclease P protein component